MCCPTFQPWEHAISYGPDLILIENHSKKNVSFRSLRGPIPARLILVVPILVWTILYETMQIMQDLTYQQEEYDS